MFRLFLGLVLGMTDFNVSKVFLGASGKGSVQTGTQGGTSHDFKLKLKSILLVL